MQGAAVADHMDAKGNLFLSSASGSDLAGRDLFTGWSYLSWQEEGDGPPF